MTIAESIHNCRKKAGLSQAKVEKMTGVTAHALSKIEYFGNTPGISRCIELAKLFGISIDELVGNPHKALTELHSPREWRKKRGMSVRKLSDISGVSTHTIYYGIERQKHDVSVINIEACADALGLGIDEYIACVPKTAWGARN